MKRYTDEQIIAAVEEMGSQAAAAIHLGINRRTLERRIANIRSKEAGEQVQPTGFEIPEGHIVRGTSTLLDAETGEPKLEWVKTALDKQQQIEAAKEAVEALTQQIEPATPKKSSDVADNLMSVIPITDMHVGMYAWGQEVGEDYDTEKAITALTASVGYLVDMAPRSKTCVIMQLGDFFHAENMDGVTSRSKNVLDVDTRMPRVINQGMIALRHCIEKALERHERVQFVSIAGNHDEILGHALRSAFKMLYRDEPRVEVLDSPSSRQYIKFGKVLIGATHGHQTKDRDLPGIMATERPEDWGQTKHRYFFRGHHHHDNRVEYNGCIVEQFRTMSAGDAYAVQHGYLSGRDMKVITYDPNCGEMSRSVCSVDLVRRLYDV
ncbi:helix-turn-helix domain-containing protein [Spiribacter sp. 390]|uniref:Helix-turn-helix domain-containing protein n=1 Tax=Spiribacter pallidus TaxID=1987936 RepID=A0ABV3TE52_9GAMM